MEQKGGKWSIPDFDVFKAILETVRSSVDAAVWGKESAVSQVNLKIIYDWFKIQKRSHPRGRYGALYTKSDLSSGVPRLYQALFDSDWRCLVARQIVSSNIDEQVKEMIGDKNLILFDPKFRPTKRKTPKDKTP